MLEDLKLLLGIPAQETKLDDQLRLIKSMTEQRLAVLLGASSVPLELDWIVTEVCVKRFNRIGSEGMTSHEVEGEVLTYDTGDFKAYQSEIDAWKQTRQKKGKVRFL